LIGPCCISFVRVALDMPDDAQVIDHDWYMVLRTLHPAGQLPGPQGADGPKTARNAMFQRQRRIIAELYQVVIIVRMICCIAYCMTSV
jgi:hypothetical protein